MPNPEDDLLGKKSQFNGLAHEIGEIIRDKEFQETVNKFVPKNETGFRILKGVGFVVVLASGLLGYLLKANSESDDRKAEMIHKIIDEKEKWAQKVNLGILELRRARFLTRYACDHERAPSLYERGKMQFQTRHDFIESFTGIREIFGDHVLQTCLDLAKFDEGVKNTCAKDAPNDEAYRGFLRQVNEQMHSSIKKERDKLEQLSRGVFEGFFKVL